MTTSLLRFAPTLTLPLDAVTQRLAFLGRIGSGKSYASTKLAELMLDAGAQVVAIDPVGVWYGLRVDGKGKGIAIPVFGGLHGDVPLEPGAGALIADLIIDRRLSCVLDVSQFEHDTDKARFAAAFAARFYWRKKAAPSAVHVFLEECQEFIPQNTAKGEEQMLHSFTRMAKLGRNFGIGLSLISQRPQEVSKKVLNLTECLLAFQMTGTHERKAIKEWIATVGADENILTVLPKLAVGVAHVYSPQWLRVSEQVKCYEKRSADVSSTPAVDAAPVEAKPLTPVDLGKIREQMAATIEKAKADDPKVLRNRIAALMKELASMPARTIEKPVVDERAIARAVAAERLTLVGVQSQLHAVHREATQARERADAVLAKVGEIQMSIQERLSAEDSRADVQVGHHEQGTGAIRPSATSGGQQSRSTTRSPLTPRAKPADGVSAGGQKILNALAELAAIGVKAPSRKQLGMYAGYNLTGGTGAQHIADLAKAGYVDLPTGAVTLTNAGRAISDSGGTPSTLADVHERVLAKLSDGQRKIAEYLIEIHPESISRADLGAAVNYNLTGGTGAQHVADLVTVGAAEIPVKGKLVASDLLFPDGLR